MTLPAIAEPVDSALLVHHAQFISRQLKPCTFDIEDMEIYAPAGVYHPYPQSSSRFTLAHLPGISHKRVLDMGCGSGVLGLALAKREYFNNVTLSDISPAAVATAEINAMHNHRKAEVVLSDVWQNLMGRKFDVVIWNIPLMDAPLNHWADEVACDPNGVLAGRFFEGLDAHLEEGGCAYVTTSSHSKPIAPMAKGFQISVAGVEERESGLNIYLVQITR